MGIIKKLKQKFFSSQPEKELTSKVIKDQVLKTDGSGSKIDEIYYDESIEKYKKGFVKSKKSFLSNLAKVFSTFNKIDDIFFSSLSEALLLNDVGYLMTKKIIEEIKTEVKTNNLSNPEHIKELLIDKIFVLYSRDSFLDSSLKLNPLKTNIILLSGINGSGKTTTAAKLANILQKKDYKIILVACDTFRAAAQEQLKKWSKELDASFIGSKFMKQDPTSVLYEALEYSESIKAKKVLIVDTAGRLQNKINLMKELEKINRIIHKKVSNPNIINLLIIDAMIGQNSLNQANEFNKILNLDGLILTKLDGTSRGGIILNIKEQLNIPVKYIGVGERVEDLEEFDLEKFVYSLFEDIINE